MKYGILKVGDVVVYTEEAHRVIGEVVDRRRHKVVAINCNEQNADFKNSDGADIYWLELAPKTKKQTRNGIQRKIIRKSR